MNTVSHEKPLYCPYSIFEHYHPHMRGECGYLLYSTMFNFLSISTDLTLKLT